MRLGLYGGVRELWSKLASAFSFVSALIGFFFFGLCYRIIDNAFCNHDKKHNSNANPPLTRCANPPADKRKRDPKKAKNYGNKTSHNRVLTPYQKTPPRLR